MEKKKIRPGKKTVIVGVSTMLITAIGVTCIVSANNTEKDDDIKGKETFVVTTTRETDKATTTRETTSVTTISTTMSKSLTTTKTSSVSSKKTTTTTTTTTTTKPKTTVTMKKAKKANKTTTVSKTPKWDGPVLNSFNGFVTGPSGNETFYNMDMTGCINMMRGLGYDYEYWVRDDGVKMYGNYVMCAANLDIRPKGTILETSLGTAIVVDTGDFAGADPTKLDIAVTW